MNKKSSFLASISYPIILCLIVFAAIYLSSLTFSLLFLLILGENVKAPIWTFIFQAVTYIFAVIMILELPKSGRAVSRLPSFRRSKPHRFITKLKHFLPLGQNTRDQLGLSGLPTWTDIGLAPIALIVSLLAGTIVLAIIQAIFPQFNAAEAQTIGYSTTIFGFDRIVAFMGLCIIAPIAEELLFRGWLYAKLRLKIGAILSAIICGAFFGLVHGQLNVAISVGLMGLVACFLREITGTIYASILLHILKNAIAFGLLFIVGL